MLLDLTLNDLEGQNQYRMNFSTHHPQNGPSSGKYSDEFHIWKRTPLVIIYAGVDFWCNASFVSLYEKIHVCEKRVFCALNPRIRGQ